MKLKLPDWCLENATTNGTLQCGFCGHRMQIEGRGVYGDLDFGIFHYHHKQCPLFPKNQEWEYILLTGRPRMATYQTLDPTQAECIQPVRSQPRIYTSPPNGDAERIPTLRNPFDSCGGIRSIPPDPDAP